MTIPLAVCPVAAMVSVCEPVVLLKKTYSPSTAGTNTTISPVKAPVNSITLFAASAVASASPVVKVMLAEPATDLAKYNLSPNASKTSKLLLVFVPQVLALAPVAIFSNFKLLEHVLCHV